MKKLLTILFITAISFKGYGQLRFLKDSTKWGVSHFYYYQLRDSIGKCAYLEDTTKGWVILDSLRTINALLANFYEICNLKSPLIYLSPQKDVFTLQIPIRVGSIISDKINYYSTNISGWGDSLPFTTAFTISTQRSFDTSYNDTVKCKLLAISTKDTAIKIIDGYMCQNIKTWKGYLNLSETPDIKIFYLDSNKQLLKNAFIISILEGELPKRIEYVHPM